MALVMSRLWKRCSYAAHTVSEHTKEQSPTRLWEMVYCETAATIFGCSAGGRTFRRYSAGLLYCAALLI